MVRLNNHDLVLYFVTCPVQSRGSPFNDARTLFLWEWNFPGGIQGVQHPPRYVPSSVGDHRHIYTDM
jgi:hypothetical protein